MQEFSKHAAELALRLMALPSNELRCDDTRLDAIERLAMQILTEIAQIRAGKPVSVGEQTGTWRAMRPGPPQ